MTRLRILAVALLAALGSCATTTTPVHNAPSGGPQTVTDMDGVAHSLSGRPVALVFWQTWCASCKREAPEVTAAARRNEGRIQFLGVVPGSDEDVDDREVEQVAREWGLAYPQVRDRDLGLSDHYDVEGTPTIIVLDAGGQVRYRGHRPPADWGALVQ